MRILGILLLFGACGVFLLTGCSRSDSGAASSEQARALLGKYTSFRLTTDTSLLSEKQRQMLPLLIDAARMMDDAFWRQAWGDRDELLDSIDDPDLRRFAEINYGPWDRLDDNRPFIEGIGPQPAAARCSS